MTSYRKRFPHTQGVCWLYDSSPLSTVSNPYGETSLQNWTENALGKIPGLTPRNSTFMVTD